jgi:hypothetical protein
MAALHQGFSDLSGMQAPRVRIERLLAAGASIKGTARKFAID